MNYEEFDRICWKTQIQGQFTIYKMIRSTLRRLFVEGLRGLFVETMSSRFNSPLNPPKGGRTAMRC